MGFEKRKLRVGISALQIRRGKRYFFILIVMAGILLAAYPAYCSTYFVDPNGSDSNIGDINHPFKTITQGVTAAAAGDTIYLRGGQHNYSATIQITKSGSSGNLITLQNYQNETAIVDFSGLPRVNNTRGIELSGNYWHFKGFTIRRSADDGIYLTGSHNIFEQLIFYENGDSGIHFLAGATASPAYNQVINCDSYLNYDPYVNGENADGFAVKSSSLSYSLGPGNVLRGCRAWNNSDDGYDLWYAGNAVTIDNCWAWRNGVDLWGEGGNFRGDGQGIKLGQGGGAHIVTNCLSYYNQFCGFDLNRSTTDATGVTLYNCTGVRNLDKNFKFSNPTTGAIHVLRNNISHRGSVTIGTLIDNTYNSWNSGFSVSDADFASLDANGLDDPRGPNGELPKLRFMRLAPTSALIDAGTTAGLPGYMTYYGSAPDLGAFEHIDGDCQPDGDVDWADLECLTDNWLDSSCGTCNGADFDGDNKVNFYDFVIMADNWLK